MLLQIFLGLDILHFVEVVFTSFGLAFDGPGKDSKSNGWKQANEENDEEVSVEASLVGESSDGGANRADEDVQDEAEAGDVLTQLGRLVAAGVPRVKHVVAVDFLALVDQRSHLLGSSHLVLVVPFRCGVLLWLPSVRLTVLAIWCYLVW